MKKLFSILLLASMLLSLLAGCGNTPDTPMPPVEPDTSTTPETPAEPGDVTPDAPSQPETPGDPLWQPPADMTEAPFTIGNTYEERQAAILATALAYYDKGVAVQYDREVMTHLYKTSGGSVRGWVNDENTPEWATEDLTTYDVCSAFGYDSVRGALGYELLGSSLWCVTLSLSTGEVPKELLIFQHDYSQNMADNTKAALECMDLLEPGDLITYNPASGTGHTMIYGGDLDGDGIGDIIHCSGNKYNFAEGKEVFEETGAILIDPARESLLTESVKRFLVTKEHFSIVRPALIDANAYPITDTAKARMTYPRMAINRTVDCGFWGSVEEGGTLTYTIAITNNSTQDYKGLPVRDVVADNAVLISVDGVKANGGNPAWKIDVPAGQTVTLTYTVAVTGKAGDTVVSTGGSVSAIAMNTLTTSIQAFTPTGDNLKNAALLTSAENRGVNGSAFVNALYADAYGIDPQIPEIKDVIAALYDRIDATTYRAKAAVAAEYTALAQMQVPRYWGGMSFISDEKNERVLELRLRDLKPGDILLMDQKLADRTAGTAWIFDGENMLALEGRKVVKKTQADMVPLLSYDFFLLLRPSLAVSGSNRDLTGYEIAPWVEIETGSGSVSGSGWTPLSAENQQKLAALTLEKWNKQVNLNNFGKWAYAQIGLDVGAALEKTLLTLRPEIFTYNADEKKWHLSETPANAELAATLVEGWWGGANMAYDGKTKDFTLADLQVGDILCKYKALAGGNYYWIAVYQGDGKFLASAYDQSKKMISNGTDREVMIADANTTVSIMGTLNETTWDFYCVIRPAQFYLDINVDVAG